MNDFLDVNPKTRSRLPATANPDGPFSFLLQRRPAINRERREQGFDKKKSLRRMRGWGPGRGRRKQMCIRDRIKEVAAPIAGSGGGRPDQAQAGGTNPAGIDEAMDVLKAKIGE